MILLAILATEPESTATAPPPSAPFQTEYFSYGRLQMTLPLPCVIDTVKGRDYTWYAIKTKTWSIPLNLLVGYSLPSKGFTDRNDVVIAGRERKDLAGTKGMATWGTYKDKSGLWFDFTSSKLFGKDVFLRVWYERATESDTMNLRRAIETLEVIKQ
ncbi:MAG: hypothetical protein ACP5QG_04670 [candidate division WOR-3 bacterium]